MNNEEDAEAGEIQQTVRELDSVMVKLSLLIESLNGILLLHPATPWPLVLSQLNNIIARYESILRELQLPAFAQALVHPHVLIQQDPDFIPRILLRTKLIPEIEDEEREVVAEYLRIGQDDDTIADGMDVLEDTSLQKHLDMDTLSQTSLIKKQREWEGKVQAQTELIQASLEIYLELRQELNPMLKGRIRESAEHLSVSNSVGRTTQATPLEQTLSWMSSGPPL
ncbi:hypothetical protein BASA50_004070 [Batrachochytrium salamandrivorans]|uniref:Mediator of RNA polymerase II transcription subunit 8 n=1 Tax=Batrachochytrium salamandrivorans TaxID=1357716 RepID=A0ABQ8FGF7_9FUNG|nr:hypothetical protein BASA62_006845 [Batrachochytrium salamandrivorans]KAH6586033.1 hypothetical protein BASA61_006656 [Batrachochytrium salamandrivorans]KAH6597915.1 hypothetical protein BASA50_004070 [Batrachochytrium salamandrivorans]KAH9246279.1 hypothetical protein BASA81_016201 [Batrachochytrium salamandrivorans]KAH9263527.1 hypothetical protein BASA83_013083 [Batrachochytrium salamandrivorans]